MKYYLGLHAKKYGIKSLGSRERDFLEGRIDYNTLLYECYDEYSEDKTVCIPPDLPVMEEDIYD